MATDGDPPTVAAAPAADAGSPAERRLAALSALVAARDERLPISARVGVAAAALGVSPRSVWRWLRHGLPVGGGRRRWLPVEADIDAYTGWRGNAAAAWRARRAEDPSLPSLRTFERGLRRVLHPGDRAAIRDGVRGTRRYQVYLRWAPEARNQRWECDHTLLDVPVLFPRAQRPRRPWITLYVDGFSRAIMGWAIADYPSTASVLAALGDAIRVDPDRGPFGGVPASLRPDRGLEFAAHVLRQACGVLAIHLDPAPPYQPHLKGKVERINRTLIDQLLRELPHFSGGPRDAAGRLQDRSAAVLTLAALVAAVDSWVRWYNAERPHTELDGETPRERWLEDATPVRLVRPAELRWTLLDGKTRTVTTSGIGFHGLRFIAPELNGLVGCRVEIRFRPHDDSLIEVSRDGQHLCTAKPQGTLSAEERAAFQAHRRADAREQARRRRRAERRSRERFSPATVEQPAADVSVIPIAVLAARRGAGWDEELRRAARTDLLRLSGSEAVR